MMVLAGLNPNVTDRSVMSWIALFVYNLVQNVPISCLPAQCSHLRSNISFDMCLSVHLRNMGRRKPTRCYTMFY